MSLRISALSLTVAGGLLIAAGSAQADTVHLKTTLNGATEVPSVTTNGKGTAHLTLDTTTKKLSYKVTYTGLTGAATAAHIHGPADVGANAGVVVPLTSSASPLKGKVTLTDAQIADLLAGKDYINIHTAANPNGEIRGYITH